MPESAAGEDGPVLQGELGDTSFGGGGGGGTLHGRRIIGVRPSRASWCGGSRPLLRNHPIPDPVANWVNGRVFGYNRLGLIRGCRLILHGGSARMDNPFL